MARSPEIVLYGLSVSPWTLKARFALEHHRISYRFVEHVPLLGEVHLRSLTDARPVSVPLLVHRDHAFVGGRAIATWADRHGHGATLRAADPAVDEHEARAERLLPLARQLLFARMLASPRALEESLPSFVPAALRPLSRWSARLAVKFLMRKYAVGGVEPEALYAQAAAELAAFLPLVRARAGEGTLLEQFSFADLSMACALGGFFPTPAEPLRALGPATLACWTHEPLIRDFPEVFAWRDAIYANYRSGSVSAPQTSNGASSTPKNSGSANERIV